MKILHLNTYDLHGGAARGTLRLHQGLRGLGIDSQVLVQFKSGDEPHVLGPSSKLTKAFNPLRPHLEALPLWLYRRRRRDIFSLSWLPNHLHGIIASLNPDIVHLHWLCDGFVPLAELRRINRPLVWTMRDCWAFTGGCHFPGDCTAYRKSCGACPHLGSQNPRDLSHRVWRRKARHWPQLNLTMIAPSSWMAACARSSSLLGNRRIAVIPNGLNLKRYKPIRRQTAREILGLPLKPKLILCGALRMTQDARKGFNYLQQALQLLKARGWDQKARLLVFGSSEPAEPLDTGLPATFLGYLRDDISLTLAYAAADVFVAPSLQDNLPHVVMEAGGCGTPTVAFNLGGLPDLVDHLRTGYLARPLDAADLAQGIEWVLTDRERQAALAAASRLKMEQQFEISLVARRHLDLYQQLLSSGPQAR
jgi:glycosyltransferase involved in cell wall biosynthesis